MRTSMHTIPTTLLLDDKSRVPTFPVAILGLQPSAFEALRRRCPIDETILTWQMAALWSDDRTSCDAALWADRWPIVN